MRPFPDPREMRPEAARFLYACKGVACVGYLFTIALVAALYNVVPSPVWAMPIGIACLLGARASHWRACYRAHLRGVQP